MRINKTNFGTQTTLTARTAELTGAQSALEQPQAAFAAQIAELAEARNALIARDTELAETQSAFDEVWRQLMMSKTRAYSLVDWVIVL